MGDSSYRAGIGRYDELIQKLKGWMAVSIAVMFLAGAAFALALPRLGAPFHRQVSFALALLLAASFCGSLLTSLLVFFLSWARRALTRAAAASEESEPPASPPT